MHSMSAVEYFLVQALRRRDSAFDLVELSAELRRQNGFFAGSFSDSELTDLGGPVQ